jgi:hypothetical protein
VVVLVVDLVVVIVGWSWRRLRVAVRAVVC